MWLYDSFGLERPPKDKPLFLELEAQPTAADTSSKHAVSYFGFGPCARRYTAAFLCRKKQDCAWDGGIIGTLLSLSVSVDSSLLRQSSPRRISINAERASSKKSPRYLKIQYRRSRVCTVRQICWALSRYKLFQVQVVPEHVSDICNAANNQTRAARNTGSNIPRPMTLKRRRWTDTVLLDRQLGGMP